MSLLRSVLSEIIDEVTDHDWVIDDMVDAILADDRIVVIQQPVDDNRRPIGYARLDNAVGAELLRNDGPVSPNEALIISALAALVVGLHAKEGADVVSFIDHVVARDLEGGRP